jgi:hypothetical protein
VAVGFVGGAVLQAIAILGTPSSAFANHGSVATLAKLYTLKVGLGSLAGFTSSLELFRSGGWTWGYAATTFVMLALMPVLVRGSLSSKALVLTALLLSVSFFFAPLALRFNGGFVPRISGEGLAFGSRYSASPILFVFTALVVAADEALHRRPTILTRALPAVVGALVLIAVVRDFRAPNDRGPGPRWSSEVRAATRTCKAGAQAVNLLVTPKVMEFRFRVPCRRVLSGA